MYPDVQSRGSACTDFCICGCARVRPCVHGCLREREPEDELKKKEKSEWKKCLISLSLIKMRLPEPNGQITVIHGRRIVPRRGGAEADGLQTPSPPPPPHPAWDVPQGSEGGRASADLNRPPISQTQNRKLLVRRHVPSQASVRNQSYVIIHLVFISP